LGQRLLLKVSSNLGRREYLVRCHCQIHFLCARSSLQSLISCFYLLRAFSGRPIRNTWEYQTQLQRIVLCMLYHCLVWTRFITQGNLLMNLLLTFMTTLVPRNSGYRQLPSSRYVQFVAVVKVHCLL
jgi:hypothetical protein